jgi:hypothetical protein
VTRRIAWPCSFALVALAQPAFAQPGAAPPAEPPPFSTRANPVPPVQAPGATSAPEREWYGWQLLIGYGVTDLLVVGGIFAGIADGNFDGIPLPMIFISGTGLVSQVFTSPIIHWARGNVGRGFISFGLNGAVPMLGATFGLLAGSDSAASFTGFMVGMSLGLLAGRAVDVAVLAFDEVEPSSRAASNTIKLVPSLTLMPIAGPGTAGLGVAGVF